MEADSGNNNPFYKFPVGSWVRAKYLGRGPMYPGRVFSHMPDNKYQIFFVDGSEQYDKEVLEGHMEVRKRPTFYEKEKNMSGASAIPPVKPPPAKKPKVDAEPAAKAAKAAKPATGKRPLLATIEPSRPDAKKARKTEEAVKAAFSGQATKTIGYVKPQDGKGRGKFPNGYTGKADQRLQATIDNYDKQFKKKDEEIQRLQKLLDEANKAKEVAESNLNQIKAQQEVVQALKPNHIQVTFEDYTQLKIAESEAKRLTEVNKEQAKDVQALRQKLEDTLMKGVQVAQSAMRTAKGLESPQKGK